ncbi:MAG: sigma-70 family RNA polymerase sigma factor [Planctomycetota bacterium]|nr:sigma-70 family RNA polymerase sigma factor [Planctomycetota bacterium]
MANNMKADASDKLSDEELVERLKIGDESSASAIFRRYRSRVYRIARSFFDEEKSLDVVQEVFVHLLSGIKGFRAGAKFSTWLHRITINCCYDFLRRKRSRKEESVEEEILESKRDDCETPDRVVERRELETAFKSALNALSPKLRIVFTLRFFEQLSYTEMAKVLKCSLGTVMSRLFYARQRLLDALADYI